MRGKASFDWQIRDEELPGEPAPVPASGSPNRRPWLTYLALGAAILLAAGLVGRQLVQRAAANLRQVEADLVAAVEADSYLERRASLHQVAGAATSNHPAVQVQRVELQGELALVDLLVNTPAAPWYSGPYRRARVFREEADGWRATLPVASLWGAQETHNTVYFRFQVGRRDAATVVAVGPMLDAALLQMRRDLALPPPSTSERITIWLVAGPGLDEDLDISDLRYGGSTLLAPPPELVSRPVSMPLTTVLYQSVAFPLAVKNFAEARERHVIPCEWRSLTAGLGLWLRWEGNELPSRRRWEAERTLQAPGMACTVRPAAPGRSDCP
jgi:hypothetical protein